MQSIIQIIKKNTNWKYSKIVLFAKRNRVNVRREDNLILLNYEDDIPNDDWNDFNRQCRGIILDIEKKTIIAHPFDKFFNIGSHPETKLDILPLFSDYEIAVKYDGTMLTNFSYNNIVRFVTRSAFANFQTEMAKQLFQERYPQLKKVDFTKYTLIFELVSPKNHSVVRYKNTDLILIGIRNLIKNQMFTYSQVIEFAKTYGLKPPQVLHEDFLSLLKIAKDGTSQVIKEGWVVRFGSGLYVKLKTWQYLAHVQIQRWGLTKRHLIKSYCKKSPKEWLEFLDTLPPVVRDTVEQFGEDLQSKICSFSEKIQDIYEKFSQIESQKDFAITIKNEVSPSLHPFLFALRSGKLLEPLIRKNYAVIYQKEDLSTEVIHPSMIKELAF
jgi:RNA ligase